MHMGCQGGGIHSGKPADIAGGFGSCAPSKEGGGAQELHGALRLVHMRLTCALRHV